MAALSIPAEAVRFARCELTTMVSFKGELVEEQASRGLDPSESIAELGALAAAITNSGMGWANREAESACEVELPDGAVGEVIEYVMTVGSESVLREADDPAVDPAGALRAVAWAVEQLPPKVAA